MKDTETVTLDEALRVFAKKVAFNAVTKQVGSKELYVPSKPLDDAKAEIIKLFEQTVESAKPEAFKFDDGQNDATHFYNKAVSEYQQNLLRALSNSGDKDED